MEKVGKVVVVGIMVILVGILSGFLYYHPTTNIIETSETIQPIDYMQNIPPKPDDWNMIMRELESGYIDIIKMNSSYWLQPDFYPSWKVAQRFYTEHDYSRWGVYGSGAYPGNPIITFNKKDRETWISDCTLFKTGYGIETWQGIKLVPESNEYFEIEIEPNEFLLEPTFPIFSENWVRIINYKIIIKKEPPTGIYNVKIFSVSPSKENAKEWFWDVLKKESTPLEREMVTRAKLQADAEGRIPEEFTNWITLERKNKYVDASTFQTGACMDIQIIVE